VKYHIIPWFLVIIVLSWSPLPAQSAKGQQSILANRRSAITTAIEKVSPAVAGINVTAIEQYRSSPFVDDPLFNLFFPEQYHRRQVESLGSGVVISPDGYVVTNHHVVENAQEIIITLQGGERHEAKIVGRDELSDIALLKIEGDTDFPYVKMGNSDEIIIGEWVIALGNPFGLFDVSYKPTATAGIISGTQLNFGRQSTGRVYQDMIQTDAAINVGNSGGPLVNSNGEVIGINTFIFTGGGYSEGSIGIGFAIPINTAKMVMEEIITHGRFRHVWTGLGVVELDDEMVQRLNLPFEKGLFIQQIEKDGPAGEAGLKVGDIIVEIDGRAVRNFNQANRLIFGKRVGDTLQVKIWREGEMMDIELRLAEALEKA